MQVCTSLQTDSHTSTPPLSFLQAGCPFCCPTNSIKALKALKMALNKYDYLSDVQHPITKMSACSLLSYLSQPLPAGIFHLKSNDYYHSIKFSVFFVYLRSQLISA